LFVLIVCSWLYWAAAWWLVREFFLDTGDPPANFRPPVSVLKPVRGMDAWALENFSSFCRQAYPQFEILFGVSDPSDSVCGVIQRLQDEFPGTLIRLIAAPTIGSNRKASILHALAQEARYEILVISDSDMRVQPDYLERVVTELANDKVGLVTCPYVGKLAQSPSAWLEALHMGATFLPSVVVARRLLNMRFAMGATMALRRRDLEGLGGFAAFADYLADDYQLAVRMADLGRTVYLSHYVVECVLGATRFRDSWGREVRWARTNRVSRPREYPGLLLTFSTPLSTLLLLFGGFEPLGWRALAISLLLRWFVAWQVSGCTGDGCTWQCLLWLPIRDSLSALVWCAGAVGHSVTWRGQVYHLQPDGRMFADSQYGLPEAGRKGA